MHTTSDARDETRETHTLKLTVAWRTSSAHLIATREQEKKPSFITYCIHDTHHAQAFHYYLRLRFRFGFLFLLFIFSSGKHESTEKETTIRDKQRDERILGLPRSTTKRRSCIFLSISLSFRWHRGRLNSLECSVST